MERTLTTQSLEKVGQKIKLQGWLASIRDHGKISFIDLRDRQGVIQCVGQNLPKVSTESVVEIEGMVAKRPANLVNKNITTGEIEVQIAKLTILSLAQELPFQVDGDGYELGEEVKLKYRYLDLRRARLQRNLRVRSDYVQAAREYLFSKDFVEIETPLLTKSTPEGSRDFIVPSRLNPGKFFALPQSPQQYKQLLMSAGFERYFQIAKCLRDEDPRADRGFEHSQIDLEMSFVTREEVMKVVEEMTVFALEKIGAKIVKKPFPILTHKEVMETYGSDKFDLRTDAEKKEKGLAFAWIIDFPFFEKEAEGAWTFTHNPFSQPVPEHESWLMKKEKIGEILTSQYDLVCNGLEVAGGSIRSNKPEVLKCVFEILGYKDEEIENKFGHMLTAFKLGTPPHGGCAQGFERLLMANFGEEYLREVQAFPQTGRGRTSVMDAPSEVDAKLLTELGIKVVEK